jgi:DNA-binding transcriptional ArsR family regulator
MGETEGTRKLQVPGPLDRVLRALNHPIRRRILTQLSQGSASASTLAKAFDEELGVVSYHLNQVLARECGVVELVEAVPKRGALEKIYRLDPEVWKQLSAVTDLEGSGVECFPLEVDSTAWREICAARSDFQARIAAAVKAGRGRPAEDSADEVRQVIVGVGTFMASPSPDF